MAAKQTKESETKRARPVRITDDKARKAKATIWDEAVKGFHVRVTPNGTRSFRVRFQRKDGTKVCVTLGLVDAWTVDDPKDENGKPLFDKDGEVKIGARTWAERCRRAHDQGDDPRAELKETRASQDLNAWVKVWRVKHKPKLKEKTQASYESLLKNQILPVLGKRLIRSIGVDDVQAVYDAAMDDGKETSAKRAVAVLSNLLKSAERAKKIAKGSNPCRGFETHTEKPKERILNARECAALETALVALAAADEAKERELRSAVGTGRYKRVLASMPGIDSINPQTADLIRFLLFSGLRKGEGENLKFDDVDLERNTMRFTDHKTDKSAGVKVLPLNSHLREIIQRRTPTNKLLARGAYVFLGRSIDSPSNGLKNTWPRVMKAAGLINETTDEHTRTPTPHDLRRTFESTSVELGYPPAIGDVLTGHSLGKIRDAYIHLSMDGILLTASQDTADWLAAAMAGGKVKPGVKVAQNAKEGLA